MAGRFGFFTRIFAMLLVCAVFVSCEKDEGLAWKDQDRIEVISSPDGSGEKILKVVSSIKIPQEWPFAIDRDSLKMRLQSVVDHERETSFWLSYNVKDGKLLYRLYIPMSNLPDNGVYKLMQIKNGSGNLNFRRMTVTMQENRVVQMETSAADYSRMRGSGTAEDPYLVTSMTGLTSFAGSLKKDSIYHGYGLYFKLDVDIDMTDYYTDPFRVMDQGWCGIGGGFAGKFLGNGHTVSNLKHSDSGSSGIGLFKELLEGALVSDLKLELVNIASALDNVGALAGASSGSVKIENVSVSGNIAATGDNVAALVGKAGIGTLEISGCTLNSGRVDGGKSAGGFVGGVTGTVKIDKSYNKAFNIYSSGGCAGGFIGALLQGTAGNAITESESYAVVSGNTAAGGVVGQSRELAMDSVYVQTDGVSASGGSSCGGIAGENLGTLSINDANVFHSSSANYTENIIGDGNTSFVGGFVGYSGAGASITIKESQMNAPVTGNERTGGFVGSSSGPLTIENCTVSNSSRLEGTTRTGGFVGFSDSDEVLIKDSYQYCPVVAAKGYAGGIIGESGRATFTNVTVDASVTGGDYYVGGVVGYGTGIVLESVDLGTITVDGPNDVGGVAGRLVLSFLDATSLKGAYSGKVCSSDSFFSSAVSVGGIAGSADKCVFNNIAVSCSVFGKNNVAGITGHDDGGIYENCTFEGFEVNASEQNAGGIIGKYRSGSGKLTGLVNKGTVKGPSHTGGIVGEIMNIGMESCINSGTVSGGQDTGGIVGRIDNDEGIGEIWIQGCKNEGTVEANKRCLGGIAGYVESGGRTDNTSTMVYFSKCYNTGNVTGTGAGATEDDGMGGIVGEGKFSIQIQYCGNKGNVRGSSGFRHIGGLIGYFGQNSYGYYNYAYIMESYNSGTVEVTQSGANDTFVGGIAGHLEDSNTSSWNMHIKNCYNKGTVRARTTEKTYHAGGMVGKASFYLAVEYCYCAGNVRSQEENGSHYRAPGMAGCHAGGESLFPDSRLNSLYIEDGSAWDDWNESLPVIIDWGSYFKYEDRGNTSTFDSFDFTNIWAIDSNINGGYPYLRNNHD